MMSSLGPCTRASTLSPRQTVSSGTPVAVLSETNGFRSSTQSLRRLGGYCVESVRVLVVMEQGSGLVDEV